LSIAVTLISGYGSFKIIENGIKAMRVVDVKVISTAERCYTHKRSL